MSVPAVELRSLSDSFADARVAARDALLKALAEETDRLLRFELHRRLPHWHLKDLEAREYLERLGLNEPNRKVRVSLELTPKATHPDSGWIYEADPEIFEVLRDLGLEVTNDSNNGEDGVLLVIHINLREFGW